MKNIGKLRLLNEFDLDQVRLWRNHESIRKNMYKRHIISEKEPKNVIELLSKDFPKTIDC